MGSDTSGSGVPDGDDREAPMRAPSRRIDRISTPLGEILSPARVDAFKKGVKALFTLLLATLLVYWVTAFYFGVALFEF
ncbi:hypothetical protein [Natrinema salifodinae]|uniref:Uncharacterized protein n=1 Tax=Natrinema salifodinae TaxID=1202768 RepID=A0A1I0LX66_9EURY|nr:hypothetical protein [Natrinema salifodinae]SEV79991.1 hypothetical protein SAMN05216285_0053 [Natrinema salifodinae]